MITLLFVKAIPFHFQKDVDDASKDLLESGLLNILAPENADLLKLGLLFGDEIDSTTTDHPEVLSFQHKLIQEYLAAVYIVENIKHDPSAAFLKEAFPTWEKIEIHREVVQFVCGMLRETDASTITNHAGKVLREIIQKGINEGSISCCIGNTNFELLKTFQKEGNVSLISPHVSWYPGCECLLNEVLPRTKLTVINGVNKKETSQPNASSTPIILVLKVTGRDGHDRLSQNISISFLIDCLNSMQANVVAIRFEDIDMAKQSNLKPFSQLKYLHISGVEDCELEGLAQSIESWGPHPPLLHCQLISENKQFLKVQSTPKMLLTGLSRCKQLRHLDLCCICLHNMLSLLLASPLPALKKLGISICSLMCLDMHDMTEAFKEGRLPMLEELDMHQNPIGETALGSLCHVILTTPHVLKKLDLGDTGDTKLIWFARLSDKFISEWKDKLMHIDVVWEGVA